MVLTPVAGKRRLAIDQFTAFEKITEIIQAVIVQRVGIQRRFTMFENHITTGLSQLVVTIIIGIVAEQLQRVTL